MNGLVSRRLFPSESRSPFRSLGSLHREIDALFEGVFGTRAVEPVADWAPRVDTYVKDDALHVRADLPGVDPKKVDISLEGDVLTIRGERELEHEDASYREVTYGRFERRIRVPEGTEADKITARCDHGVLDVTVPLPKPVNRKVKVDVKTGGTIESRPAA
jgi:HSP20 family protein